MSVTAYLFWLCLTASVWPYLGYPACLALLRPRRKPVRRSSSIRPTISLVISAHNEAKVMRQRLENALAVDYPGDQLEIVVLSDASDDGTDECATEYAERGVKLLRQEVRRGKSAAIEQFVAATLGEVIVFSDANSMYRPDALLRLVEPFADPSVGFVSGRQVLELEETAVFRGESLYRRYETWVKRAESDIGSVVGGYGSILAVRRTAWHSLAPDEMNDFTLPLRIVVSGLRGIFEPRALCAEWPSSEFGGEYQRRVRTVARGVRSVARVPASLDPRRVGVFAFQLFSHKVLRWLGPFTLAGTAVSAALLASTGSPVGMVALAAGGAAALAAAAALSPPLRRHRPIGLAGYFATLQAAAAVGVLSALLGRRYAVWNPVASTRRNERVST